MNALLLLQAATLVLTAFFTSAVTLMLVAWQRNRNAKVPDVVETSEIAFLFDGEQLVDASPAGHRLLEVTARLGSDIARLVGFLAPRFPDLHDTVLAANELDALEVSSSDGRSLLRVGIGGGRLRIRLEDCDDDHDANPDRHMIEALRDELSIHREVGAALPMPAWRQRLDGQIVWANAAYMDLARALDPELKQSAVPPDLFDLQTPASVGAENVQRVKIEFPKTDDARWFDCATHALGSDFLCIAAPADRMLQAERKLREFTLTLTQTFAHLNVGLAIFDRSRRLSLFNPALSDLLGLSPEYLISHPPLSQFLDRLRDSQMMPEPKDYKTWRHQMIALEEAAVDGSYSETWPLPDGRTYRATGRPHPNGAVAFLFEDISAEISLSRRFKSELETGQAVIDSLDEAIAVFSPAGYLTMSNRVYGDLWQSDPGKATDISFLEATRAWQQLCTPTPVWGDARDFAATIGERSNWTSEVRLQDGRRLCCRFEALPGGSTLAAFAEPGLDSFAPVEIRLEPARA